MVRHVEEELGIGDLGALLEDAEHLVRAPRNRAVDLEEVGVAPEIGDDVVIPDPVEHRLGLPRPTGLRPVPPAREGHRGRREAGTQ